MSANTLEAASETGIASVDEQPSFTGRSDISDPYLFPAPGGALQMAFGLHSSTKTDPLNGTLIAQGTAAGTFANPPAARSSRCRRPRTEPQRTAQQRIADSWNMLVLVTECTASTAVWATVVNPG